MKLWIIPRWSGGPQNDFYPWLSQQLAEKRSRLSQEALFMPNPGTPTIEAWCGVLLSRLLAEPNPEEVVLMGHSVGCQAVLRMLAMLPEGKTVGGVYLVAAWWAVDSPWETILPWMHTPFDLARTRQASPWFRVFLSTNDPFTKDYEANQTLFKERLSAVVRVVEGAKHFNAAQEPSILNALLQDFA